MSKNKSTRAERAKQEVSDSEQAPAQQITDFSSLDLTPVNVNRYIVTNRASGTVHKVNLPDRTCSCEDPEYSQGPNGACKHILYAVYHAPRTRDMNSEVLRDAARLFQQTRDAVESASAGDSAPSEASASAADAMGADDETDDRPPANPDTAAQEEAEAAAERLQAAFDDVIDDMQVTANSGLVWFQTGYETPDEWPYPGMDNTFNAITSSDAVMYVHDGSDEWADSPHEHYNEKPGQYFKNALYPSDVDEYINEVLA